MTHTQTNRPLHSIFLNRTYNFLAIVLFIYKVLLAPAAYATLNIVGIKTEVVDFYPSVRLGRIYNQVRDQKQTIDQYSFITRINEGKGQLTFVENIRLDALIGPNNQLNYDLNGKITFVDGNNNLYSFQAGKRYARTFLDESTARDSNISSTNVVLTASYSNQSHLLFKFNFNFLAQNVDDGRTPNDTRSIAPGLMVTYTNNIRLLLTSLYSDLHSSVPLLKIDNSSRIWTQTLLLSSLSSFYRFGLGYSLGKFPDNKSNYSLYLQATRSTAQSDIIVNTGMQTSYVDTRIVPLPYFFTSFTWHELARTSLFFSYNLGTLTTPTFDFAYGHNLSCRAQIRNLGNWTISSTISAQFYNDPVMAFNNQGLILTPSVAYDFWSHWRLSLQYAIGILRTDKQQNLVVGLTASY